MNLRSSIPLLALLFIDRALSQIAPESPYRPWHGSEEKQFVEDAKHFREVRFSIEPNKVYSLAELIDLAESHNPDTRVAWERARAQLAVLDLARSELYPTLSVLALSEVDRAEVPFGSQFYRQTEQALVVELELNYTVFDFGRAGRISRRRLHFWRPTSPSTTLIEKSSFKWRRVTTGY